MVLEYVLDAIERIKNQIINDTIDPAGLEIVEYEDEIVVTIRYRRKSNAKARDAVMRDLGPGPGKE